MPVALTGDPNTELTVIAPNQMLVGLADESI
jgi:hypothetical protein